MRAKLTIAGLLLATVAVGLYWYSQRGMKLSETDSILIGEFSNAAGDSVFDGTLREALGVSLAQSPSLNLVSVEKVLYPRDDIAKGNLSSEYFLIGDYEQAATLAQHALRLDPGSAAWYENLATAYIALQRLEEAQNIVELAFARKLDDPSMHAELYALAFLRGEPAAMEREMTWSDGKPGGA